MILRKQHIEDYGNRYNNTETQRERAKHGNVIYLRQDTAGQNQITDNKAEENQTSGMLIVHDFQQQCAGQENECACVENKVRQAQIVRQVLDKANHDSDFWCSLIEDSELALFEFELSSEARTAIASGDIQWVRDNVGDISHEQAAFLYARLEREAW